MPTLVKLKCMHCGKRFLRAPAQMRNPERQFCSLKCSGVGNGLAKRTLKNLPQAEQKRRKAEYDREYRRVNMARIKQGKREWYRANRDPERERLIRQQNMRRHVEYCRNYYADPKRKAEKQEYDAARRARIQYGEYAECYRLLKELDREIRKREPDWYERAKARGYYENVFANKKEKRRAEKLRIE